VESLNVKNVSVMKPTLRNSIGTRKDLEFYANSALSLVKDGKLKIKVHKIYPLEDVRRAHEDLEGRKTTGKLLLRL
jgi:NADPH2:quinone reductase